MAKIDDIKDKSGDTIYPRTLTKAVYEEGTNKPLDVRLTEINQKANEAFTSASNGKVAISDAITGVDNSVVIPTDPTFSDLASAIGGISTGKKWATGFITANNVATNTTVSGLGFRPSLFIYENRNGWGVFYEHSLSARYVTLAYTSSGETKSAEKGPNTTLTNDSLTFYCPPGVYKVDMRWFAFEVKEEDVI